MNFPFLTVITFTPAIAGVLILLMPKERGTLIKSIALVATIISAVLTFFIFITYKQDLGGYQFVEGPIDWVKSLGISYLVGADGINLVMLILTGIVSVMGVIISWGINERPKEFFAFFLFLVAGVYGVFMSLDLFLLIFFYELSIFPMYFFSG